MPIYSFLCESCGFETPELILTISQKEEFCESEVCPACNEAGSFCLDWSKLTFTYVPTKGMPDWERRIMQERYKKRNAQLDAMPPEQQEKMKKFMNKWGVNKTAPSGFTNPQDKHLKNPPKE